MCNVYQQCGVFIVSQSLCSNCSRCIADLCSEFVLSSFTAGSAPSAGQGQSVLQSMKLTVTNQMQREERDAHTHLHMLREQLQQCRQVTQSHAVS